MNLPVEDSLKSFLWFHATIFGYIQRYGNNAAYLTGEDRKAFAACLKLVVLDYPSHQVACVMCLAKHHRDISGLGVGTQQMGKKSKSKASREVNDDTVAVEEEKLPSSVKKPISDVDKTSSAKKRKKPETERGENPPSSAKKPASEIDEIFAAKKKKKTETGKAKKRKENAIEKRFTQKMSWELTMQMLETLRFVRLIVLVASDEKSDYSTIRKPGKQLEQEEKE